MTCRLFPVDNKVPMMCESLDTVLMRNAGTIFDTVVFPPELSTPGKLGATVYFLGTYIQYIIHQLFIFVFRDGHHRRRICWRGAFGIQDILCSTHGDVIIDFRAPYVGYCPEGGAADRKQLYAIIDTYLRPGFHHAVHVEPLLTLLQNDDENLWADKDFITFVINHPCLLSFADKYKWYNLVDQMVQQLSPNDLETVREFFKEGMWLGWHQSVRSVPGMLHAYMYNARFDQATQSLVSLYTYHLDQAFHLGWNFLKHPPPGVRFPSFLSVLLL